MVELLAKAGNEKLRFSDIAREVDLTQGTAHAILTTLCDRGWLVRDPADKTFSLGPALSLIAGHSDVMRPLAHAARMAAQQLSEELDYPASVVERVGDSMVITAYETGDSRQRSGSGDRIPYAPPFGVAFAAWDTRDGQRVWIERGATTNTVLAQRLEDVLARTRKRGFDVDWTTPALAAAAHLVGKLERDGVPLHVREIMDQLVAEYTTIGFLSDDDPARMAQPIATIAAPVFDDRQRVALIVCVHPLRALTPRQVDSVGRRLVRTADDIGA